MGETTYVMRPVAYTSIYSIRENPKESAMQAALSQSISFGRFMSETLSWEKWSTFTSKKYVEEAERFSQPGSVAEKKAFFEAHYRQMAAKKHTLASIEEDNVAVTSSPRNSPREKLDNIKEQDEEESNTKDTKSSVLSGELKTMANETHEVAAETTCLLEESEMTTESKNQFTESCESCDDKDEKIEQVELNLNEPIPENNENEESSEISVLEEETDMKVVESQHDLDKHESGKMESNEEPESESPYSDEYHSVKQESVSSEEAFLVSVTEEDSRFSTPSNENIIIMESPRKKKSTARWLKPLRVTPAKEFNFFSLTVKMKPNKTKNSAEVTANGALKYREITPETETRASKKYTAIAESKNNPNGRSPSTARFSQLWNKCTKKLFLSSFKLKKEEKAKKKETVEKKPSKWGLTHCFKPSPYRKNHREKAKMEDQMKMIAVSSTDISK